MRPVTAVGSVDMASSPEDVWPFLTDTDRGNRLIGTHPVEFKPIDDPSGTAARFLAETRAGGFKLVYEELPFEWSYGRAFSIRRLMRSGPLVSYALHWTLRRLTAKDGMEGGTRATVKIELLPRSIFLWPIAWLNARRFVSNLVHLASAIDAHVRDKAPSPYLKPVSASDDAQRMLAVAELKKTGLDPALADKLGDFVRDAADADVVRIRPYEVAEQWRTDRRETLRAFLRAVAAGLVELRWGIICPSCQTASKQVRALEEISLEGHCQLCDIRFDLDLDRAVEATFLPHPAVRGVPEQLFCIGGPARTPHVLIQAIVEPKETKKLDVPDRPGRYRFFVRGGAAGAVDVDPGGADEVSFAIDPEGISPAHATVRPGGALVVESRCAEPRHVKVERLDYATLAATAHAVSMLGDFRTLFSSDLLKRGTPLKVARAAVLFSDLTGSTALYSQVGDAAAFRLVDDHFDLMREVVAAHQGVLVKTMGDAVMAAFPDGEHAARAGIDALGRFETFRAGTKHGHLVGIKLGVYSGPCYVVTANGALDYFGQTVNVASRVQHLAESGELLVSKDLYEVMPRSDRDRLRVCESLAARVKGVESPLALVRLRLAESVVQPPKSGTSLERAG